MTQISDLVERWREMGPVAWAEHDYGWIMPDGRPIVLEPWQRAVLAAWWERRHDVTTLAISNVKKTGKTTLNAILAAWRWLALPGEHLACANDLDQSQGRQFKMVADMVKRHPLLTVKDTRSRLTFEATGSTLEALSVDAAGSAGANHLTSSHTESWGIAYEQGRRAYEELTPQPGTFYGLPALRVVDSYSGHIGESETWHKLVDRGLAGERVDGDWPIYATGGLLLFHIEGEEAQRRCFRGTEAQRVAYYADQRADLRPGTFQRLHLNQRSSAECAFIAPEQWDACIVESYRLPAPGTKLALVVGLDLAIKHDNAALVACYRRDDVLHLGPYRIWRPPVELSAVEAYILRLHRDYGIKLLLADPFQAALLLERLRRAGLRAEEYPQTVSNMTEAGNTLFDTIKQRRIAIYPGADDLRRHVLNAQAKETGRGVRLVKATSARKIDAAIALAMAVTGAPARASWVGRMAQDMSYGYTVSPGGEVHTYGKPRCAQMATEAQQEQYQVSKYPGRRLGRERGGTL